MLAAEGTRYLQDPKLNGQGTGGRTIGMPTVLPGIGLTTVSEVWRVELIESRPGDAGRDGKTEGSRLT